MIPSKIAIVMLCFMKHKGLRAKYQMYKTIKKKIRWTFFTQGMMVAGIRWPMSYMHDNNACHKAKTLAVANFLVQHSIGVKDIVHEHLTLTAGTFEVRVLGKGPSWMKGEGEEEKG